MRRLPAKYVKILEGAPRRCSRRAHILGLVQWRLARGKTFTSREIVEAAKFRTTKRFVESNLDALILQGVLAQLSDGTYGASGRNEDGLIAAFEKFVADHTSEGNPCFTRKDVWMKISASINENNLDRLLKRLQDDGKITRVGRGKYHLGVVDVPKDVAPVKLKSKDASKGSSGRPDLRLVARLG